MDTDRIRRLMIINKGRWFNPHWDLFDSLCQSLLETGSDNSQAVETRLEFICEYDNTCNEEATERVGSTRVCLEHSQDNIVNVTALDDIKKGAPVNVNLKAKTCGYALFGYEKANPDKTK